MLFFSDKENPGTSTCEPSVSENPDGKSSNNLGGTHQRDEFDNPKKRYEAKRVRLFQESLKNDFPWVKFENGAITYTRCKQFPDISDPASQLGKGVSGSLRRETLVTHNSSQKHPNCKAHLDVKTAPLTKAFSRQAVQIDEK